MIKARENQYTVTNSALVKIAKAPAKALAKAQVKHLPKQSKSTCQSIASIYKQRIKK